MIDNTWLTEEYLDKLGYYKIKDDGQCGVYKCKHMIVASPTYGLLPKEYRELTFNRDSSLGVHLGISADWGTRFSIKNSLAINKEVFETLLNAAT